MWWPKYILYFAYGEVDDIVKLIEIKYKKEAGILNNLYIMNV
jgi:hypothetical protein